MLRSLIALAVLCAPAYGADYLTPAIRAQQGIANLRQTNAETEAIQWGGPLYQHLGSNLGQPAYFVQNSQRSSTSVTGQAIIVCTYQYDRTRFQRYWQTNETTLCPNQVSVK